MNFYEFTQNNSGGSWVTDEHLAHRVVIEANNEEEAMEKAQSLGVYFDGCSSGQDCGCCGDRWNRPHEIVLPYRYGTFGKEEAEKIAKKYKSDFGKTTWRFMNTHEPDPDKYDVIFTKVESYMKYLADEYGTTNPDARIFYKNGKVKEI